MIRVAKFSTTLALLFAITMGIAGAKTGADPCANGPVLALALFTTSDTLGKPQGLSPADVIRLFAAEGIAISWTGNAVTIIDDREDYGGNGMMTEQVLHAMGFHNFIKQLNGNPVTYTLTFAKPVRSFSFRRSGMIAATDSGVSNPPWTATARDANGAVVDTVSEDGIRSFSDLPGRTFQLAGSGIKSVTFAGDDEARLHYPQCVTQHSFCGYGQANLIIDDLGWCP